MKSNNDETLRTNDEDIRIEKNEQGQDIYIFDPYNSLNKLISKEMIQNVLKKYGIDTPIHNPELYKRAFIHRSHLKRPDLENQQNNVIIVPKPDDLVNLNLILPPFSSTVNAPISLSLVNELTIPYSVKLTVDLL